MLADFPGVSRIEVPTDDGTLTIEFGPRPRGEAAETPSPRTRDTDLLRKKAPVFDFKVPA